MRKVMNDQNLESRIGGTCWGVSEDSVAGIPDFARVGMRWLRCSRPMQMEVVTDGPGKYDWTRGGERSVDLAIANGMSVMGILDGRWGNETLVNKLEWCSPVWEHLDVWCDFVAAAVNHYKYRVHHWEVLNEPPFFWWYPPPKGEAFPAVNPQMRRAPVRHYAELLKATARTIRACDPTATIIAGSGFHDGYFLRQLYDLGCRDFFDVASVHYLPCQHPENFERGYKTLRRVMAKYGDEKKPLWDTESGPGGAIIGVAVESPEDYQALYQVYRHCFAHQFGLERYFWFNPPPMGDHTIHGIPVRDSAGGYSSAYQSMLTLTEQLGIGALLGHCCWKEEGHLYVFAGTRGPVSVIWATAPATAHLPGGGEAVDHLGAPVKLAAEFPLNGKPLYVAGDLRERGLEIRVTGPRETVRSCWPNKIPTAATPMRTSTRIAQLHTLTDAGWQGIPVFARRNEIVVAAPADHFNSVPTTLPAELRLAHDTENLYLEARLWDDQLDPKAPSALVQFGLRDSDPAVREWPYFINGYGLFNLHVSKWGKRLLRYEHASPDEYAAGVVPHIPIEATLAEGGLIIRAAIPWKEIGPCRPGRHNPFFATFDFARCDSLLDVPAGADPAEWSHNFVDPFIIATPSLQTWIRFE